MDLVSENKIGVAKGTPVESAAESNFNGETCEVGLYLAMARQAEREGHPVAAGALRRIAWEEAQHAAAYAEMCGKISTSTKENVEKMLAGEQAANKSKREAAVKAKESGVDEAHDFFDVSARDEARHARLLQGLLDNLTK